MNVDLCWTINLFRTLSIIYFSPLIIFLYIFFTYFSLTFLIESGLKLDPTGNRLAIGKQQYALPILGGVPTVDPQYYTGMLDEVCAGGGVWLSDFFNCVEMGVIVQGGWRWGSRRDVIGVWSGLYGMIPRVLHQHARWGNLDGLRFLQGQFILIFVYFYMYAFVRGWVAWGCAY